jgi:hypothetical protein
MLDRRRGAAVDAKGCPGHEVAQRTGAEADRGSDVLWLPEPGFIFPTETGPASLQGAPRNEAAEWIAEHSEGWPGKTK